MEKFSELRADAFFRRIRIAGESPEREAVRNRPCRVADFCIG
jgi:hypothetical protein